MGRVLISHGILVTHIDNNFVVGMDFIGKYGLVCDPEQQILKFLDESFVLLIPNNKETSVKLFVYKTARINGNSEQVMNTIIDSNVWNCLI